MGATTFMVTKTFMSMAISVYDNFKYFTGIIASVGIDKLHNQAAAMQTTKRWNTERRQSWQALLVFLEEAQQQQH
jgi:hypothetical protein